MKEVEYIYIEDDRFRRYSVKVLSCAHTIHQTVTGKGNSTQTPTGLLFYVEFLEARLDSWKPSEEGRETFDRAVASLLVLAVKEGRTYLRTLEKEVDFRD